MGRLARSGSLATRITLLWLLALGLGACLPDRDVAPFEPVDRVLFVAVDGASWGIIGPMIADGALPNFRMLQDNGVQGRLRSLLPSRSPLIWTSVATGVLPESHGIDGFVHLKDGQRHLYTSDMILVPTLWEILSSRGLSVGVTNYWFTYPALHLRGYMISDHVIPTRRFRMIKAFVKGERAPPDQEALVFPPELWETLSPLLATERLDWKAGLDAGSFDHRFQRIYNILMEDQLVIDMVRAANREFQPRLTAVYLKGVDRVSHAHWRHYEPDHPLYSERPPSERELALYADAIPWVYRHTDALLGELLSLFDEEDAVFIVSDHTFEAGPLRKKPGGPTGIHGGEKSRDGIYLFAGHGSRKTSGLGPELHVTDLAPTILYLLDQDVPGHMEGKVASEVLARRLVDSRSVIRSAPISRKDLATESEASPQPDGGVPAEAERIERLRGLGYLED